MILQALKEYYDRKAASPDSDIAPEGFERKGIPFVIMIDEAGKFIDLQDTREPQGKKLLPKVYLVPRSKTRSGVRGYETTFLLWDHVGYLLGHPKGDKKTENQHKTWLDSIKALPDDLKMDRGVSAIVRFYEVGSEVKRVLAHQLWEEAKKLPSCNMTFQLVGEKDPIVCNSKVQEYVSKSTLGAEDKNDEEQAASVIGRCLVTGEIGEIVRVHGDTRINKDSKKLVGFQVNSGYDSYGKTKAYNAPVSRHAEFAYTTALNTLLKSKSRLWLGDSLLVFWTASDQDANFEDLFLRFFNEPSPDDPDAGVNAVGSLFRSLETGTFQPDGSRKFFVLGLAPNSARIAVRLWIVDTVAGMAGKIAAHFRDLTIVHGPKERSVLSMFRMMISIAPLGKSENIPPKLAGEVMRSAIQGLPYPQTLLQAALRRIKAEHEISYPRAALIKASINRKTRTTNPNIEEELKMSLDETNRNVGYRLGRLFAALEKIQEEANPGINATIRDRFYGAASGTPVTVFGNLMRLKNHHLAKLDSPSRRIYFEKLIGSILEGIEAKIAFPAHLSLDDQGRFAVGYYHQTQAFYTKKSESKESKE